MPDQNAKSGSSGNNPPGPAIKGVFSLVVARLARAVSRTWTSPCAACMMLLLAAGNAFSDEYVDRIRQQRAAARAQTYLIEAKSALQRGDYVKTIRVLSAAIRNGAGVEAYKLRAEANYLKGAHAEAIADLTRVINSGTTDPEDRVLRADIYNALLDYDRALDDYFAAIQSAPLYLDAYRGRATVYMAREKYDLAIKDLQVVLRSEPTDAEALYNAGIACMLADLPMAARSFFARSMEAEISDRWRHRIEAMTTHLPESSAYEQQVGGLAGYLAASSREAEKAGRSAFDSVDFAGTTGSPEESRSAESKTRDFASLRKELTSPRSQDAHLKGELSGTHMGFQWTFQFDNKGRSVSGLLRIRGPVGFEETHLCTGTLDRGLVEMSDRSGYRFQGRITENLHLVGALSTSRGQSFSVDVPLKE